jgi:pantoate--beta-alanine ligase
MNEGKWPRLYVVPTPQIITTGDSLRAAVAQARQQGKTIGIVPTMGALHAGHLSLVEACRRECGFTIVTIFVNPTQFGPGEDFQRYPRDLPADLALLAPYEVNVVFAPSPEEIYRPGHQTEVSVPQLAQRLEGARRPGHFRGVATVVLKLFNLATPDVAFFGQKDYQQTLVVRRMVDDLDLPLTIRVCPTVREADGLAMSSRNAYLSPSERKSALVLHRGLRLASELVAAGECDAAVVLQAMRHLIEQEPGVQLEYVALADPETLADMARVQGPVVALVAARVGKTRLIDNVRLGE